MSESGFDCRRVLEVGGRTYGYFSLPAAEAQGAGALSALPYSLKVLAENLLRHQSRPGVERRHLEALGQWTSGAEAGIEVGYHPARVIMPDVSGLPLLNDLCAMREAMAKEGGDPARINPRIPVDLIVDHSVMVDYAGSADALEKNMRLEMERNDERYRFLKWAEGSFERLRLVPPGNGILHQVNIEHLATVIGDELDADGARVAFPDCLIGMDSHTPMVNALGVMGWGVGGIEAGAAMLGQPISLRIPEVVGCRLVGRLGSDITATDLVLTLTERLRAHGVVQKFVEFCGPALDQLPVTDRATLSNMAPEYGATMGFVPIDARTLDYLRETGRSAERIALVDAYARAQGLWRESGSPEPVFSNVIEVDLSTVEPSMAGPFRPNQRNRLADVPRVYEQAAAQRQWPQRGRIEGSAREGLHDGAVALAAITSCTNTSNPAVMLGAGLLAKKAREHGLSAKPWVKTSLSPGSRVVADYLRRAGLDGPLDELGFQLTGFGCTVCMGNSGDLESTLSDAVANEGLSAVAVLSGNRNFEGRVHAQCAAAFLATPPLVVAYAIAGTIKRDLSTEPLGEGANGQPVFLADIWPSREEVEELAQSSLSPELFTACYDPRGAFGKGEPAWQALGAAGGTLFGWDEGSHYLVRPPYFGNFERTVAPVEDIVGARSLLMVGDAITTDHISPVGAIAADGVAGRYLQSFGIEPKDFNSFAARRANHAVMVRGTFSSARLHNELAPKAPVGGMTRHEPSAEVLWVFEAAQRYRAQGVPLVVIGGREYGTGSSRDWAAKGTHLLGVRAVIAESIERIHRSNLVGMGVLPAQFPAGVNRKTLALNGTEQFSITGLDAALTPGGPLALTIDRADGSRSEVELLSRLDTQVEVDYFRHGGMLPFALREALLG